jgi:hypothetical protein
MSSRFSLYILIYIFHNIAIHLYIFIYVCVHDIHVCMYYELIQHVQLTSSTYFFISPPPSVKSTDVSNNIKIFSHWFILTQTRNSFRITMSIPPVTNVVNCKIIFSGLIGPTKIYSLESILNSQLN